MEAIFIILLVFFSIGIGLFLGVLVFSLSPTFSKKITSGLPNLVRDLSSAAPRPEGEQPKQEELQKPTADAKLLLQIWKVADNRILYGIKGEFVEKGELSDEVISLLKPLKASQDAEKVSQFFNMDEVPAREIPGEEDKEEVEAEPLSLIHEINEILQEKLSSSSLSHKGIRLTENYNNEITIWVGLESYSSIEAVPDPDIQDIIQESVQDWEKKAQ